VSSTITRASSPTTKVSTMTYRTIAVLNRPYCVHFKKWINSLIEKYDVEINSTYNSKVLEISRIPADTVVPELYNLISNNHHVLQYVSSDIEDKVVGLLVSNQDWKKYKYIPTITLQNVVKKYIPFGTSTNINNVVVKLADKLNIPANLSEVWAAPHDAIVSIFNYADSKESTKIAADLLDCINNIIGKKAFFQTAKRNITEALPDKNWYAVSIKLMPTKIIEGAVTMDEPSEVHVERIYYNGVLYMYSIIDKDVITIHIPDSVTNYPENHTIVKFIHSLGCILILLSKTVPHIGSTSKLFQEIAKLNTQYFAEYRLANLNNQRNSIQTQIKAQRKVLEELEHNLMHTVAHMHGSDAVLDKLQMSISELATRPDVKLLNTFSYDRHLYLHIALAPGIMRVDRHPTLSEVIRPQYEILVPYKTTPILTYDEARSILNFTFIKLDARWEKLFSNALIHPHLSRFPRLMSREQYGVAKIANWDNNLFYEKCLGTFNMEAITAITIGNIAAYVNVFIRWLSLSVASDYWGERVVVFPPTKSLFINNKASRSISTNELRLELIKIFKSDYKLEVDSDNYIKLTDENYVESTSSDTSTSIT
jgi:hypothetical protein